MGIIFVTFEILLLEKFKGVEYLCFLWVIDLVKMKQAQFFAGVVWWKLLLIGLVILLIAFVAYVLNAFVNG